MSDATLCHDMQDRPRLFGDVVKALREKLGLSKVALAKRAGISRAYLQLIERGERQDRVSANIVNALARELSVEPGELFGVLGQGQPHKNIEALVHDITEAYHNLDLVDIPIRGSIPAGIPFPSDEVSGDAIEIPRSALGGVRNVEKLYVVRVTGNSLNGDGIEDHDYAVVDPDYIFVDGKIYAVRLGSEVVARHVFKEDGRVRLVASNGEYKELTPRQVEILGRIILTGHWKKH